MFPPVGKPVCLIPSINLEPKVPPASLADVKPPFKPDVKPPIKAPCTPIFNESLKLLPCTRPVIPLPIKPEAIEPKPGAMKFNANGTTIGATFLNTFLSLLINFFKKNSRCPVYGFTELVSLPTIYAEGSAPALVMAIST